jgi:histidine ammonia-lyase
VINCGHIPKSFCVSFLFVSVEEWRGGGDMEQFVLDGDTLTPELLYEIGLKPNTPVTLSEEAWARIDRSRAVVLAIVSREQTVYGINTGFGNFADVRIGKDKLEELQENLILSHAAGVGEPLTIAQTRRL